MHCKHIAYTDVETQALGMSSEVYNTAMGVEHIAMTCLSKSAVLSTLSVTGCKTPTYLLTFPPSVLQGPEHPPAGLLVQREGARRPGEDEGLH